MFFFKENNWSPFPIKQKKINLPRSDCLNLGDVHVFQNLSLFRGKLIPFVRKLSHQFVLKLTDNFAVTSCIILFLLSDALTPLLVLKGYFVLFIFQVLNMASIFLQSSLFLTTRNSSLLIRNCMCKFFNKIGTW